MDARVEVQSEIVMKLMHYFLTIKKYNPVILQGINDEIWFENSNEDYKIVRIVSNHIHNNEQFEFDKNKIHFVLKQIKKKIFSFRMKTLTIYTDINDNIDLNRDKNLYFIKINENTDVFENPIIKEYFSDINVSLGKKEVGYQLLQTIGNEISESNRKKNEEVKKIFKTGKPYMTKVIIALNILIYILQIILGDQFMVTNFGLHPEFILTYHQYYRLFTCMFLHGSILHILFNMYALYIIGPQIENYYGRVKYGFIYILGGIFGSLFSVLFTRSWSVGASGAIFALLGAILFFGYYYRLYLGDVIKSQILPVIFLNLLIGFMSNNIDNAAHIGGLLGGLCVSMIVGINSKKDKSTRINEIIIATIFAVFIIYLTFFR